MRLLATAALLIPLTASAIDLPPGDPVSPSQFREYSEGWTLHFESLDGEPVGMEYFGPDGAATWQTPEGLCVDGVWKPHGAQLCFFYGIEPGVQCWRVLRDDEGMLVSQIGGEERIYRIIKRDRAPLHCAGPEENI